MSNFNLHQKVKDMRFKNNVPYYEILNDLIVNEKVDPKRAVQIIRAALSLRMSDYAAMLEGYKMHILKIDNIYKKLEWEPI